MATPASVSNLDTLCSMYFEPEEEHEEEGEEQIADAGRAKASFFRSRERDAIPIDCRRREGEERKEFEFVPAQMGRSRAADQDLVESPSRLRSKARRFRLQKED